MLLKAGRLLMKHLIYLTPQLFDLGLRSRQPHCVEQVLLLKSQFENAAAR